MADLPLEVVARARSGDRGAAAEVLRQLHPCSPGSSASSSAFTHARRTPCRTRCWPCSKGCPRFAAGARLETWATAIALRIGRRMLKREQRDVPGEAPEGIYEVDFEERVELRRLLAALEQLSPRKRDAFVLMELFDFTAQEAGHALGTFANTAASRCRHARAELVALLTNSGGSVHQPSGLKEAHES